VVYDEVPLPRTYFEDLSESETKTESSLAFTTCQAAAGVDKGEQ